MSNEYKDWLADKNEEEKIIIEKYPFLAQRDCFGEVIKGKECGVIDLEIPNGWYTLFFQMCDDIKAVLEKEGRLDDFYILVAKEKYNTLRSYEVGSSPEIIDIVNKYEEMSRFVCTHCGRPATCETQGYIASFCDDCWKNYFRHERVEWLKFEPTFNLIRFEKGKQTMRTVSFESEWKRYLERIGYEESDSNS